MCAIVRCLTRMWKFARLGDFNTTAETSSVSCNRATGSWKNHSSPLLLTFRTLMWCHGIDYNNSMPLVALAGGSLCYWEGIGLLLPPMHSGCFRGKEGSPLANSRSCQSHPDILRPIPWPATWFVLGRLADFTADLEVNAAQPPPHEVIAWSPGIGPHDP